jgi:hypothetical protein
VVRDDTQDIANRWLDITTRQIKETVLFSKFMDASFRMLKDQPIPV